MALFICSCISVFALQLIVCLIAKSRTVRLLPAAIFSAASSVWAAGLLFFKTLDYLAALVIAYYAIALAISCGLALLIYGFVRLIQKAASVKENEEKVECEPKGISKAKLIRMLVLAALQIIYIPLVFVFASTAYFSLAGRLIVTLILVFESMSIVFLAKCFIKGIIGFIKAKQYLRLCASVVLIFSVMIFVCTGIVIYFESASNDYAIAITAENSEKIESLIATKYTDDIPALSNATKIEHIPGFLDDDFKIYYEDGTTYNFWVNGCIPQLEEYICTEGYSVYLSGSEFTNDCIIVSICFAAAVASAVVLAVTRKKKQPPAPVEQTDSEAAI